MLFTSNDLTQVMEAVSQVDRPVKRLIRQHGVWYAWV